jgi:hypothetical protein
VKEVMRKEQQKDAGSDSSRSSFVIIWMAMMLWLDE